MRIGIYGGTFNPIHTAHVHLVREFIKRLSLDRVILIPTGTPPHKATHQLASGADRIEMCRLAAADIPESERSVLFLRATSGSVKVKGSEGTVLGEMLRDLGFVNIADSDNTLLENLNAESVIRRNPYRIFAVTMGDDTVKATENLNKLLEENPAWGSLDAVADGRVYVMDKKLFGTKPNARWADAYEQLAEILLDKTE